MANFEKRNIMSFRQFRAQHGRFDLVKNPKNGNYFGSCIDGTVIAVGPKAREFMEQNKGNAELVLDTLQYYEFAPTDDAGNPRVDDEGHPIWVPCLSKPAENNVVCSF